MSLSDIAAFVDETSHGSWVAPVAIILVVLIVAVLAWVFRRLRSVEEMADPAYNPDLDRHQRILREALGEEADRIPSDDDLDGLAIDWDDEMRRRGR
ncbi:hypothetical protein AB0L65_32825 [Nonomuraea sp. NPDC052116]|uniref:hypothetical protein n=1 Tax=Nonomuraea sp. NPDC052116 TaxID=3155665 RepID=UPI00343AFDEC